MAIKIKVIKHKDAAIKEAVLFEAQPATQSTQGTEQQTAQPAAQSTQSTEQQTAQPAAQSTQSAEQSATQPTQPADTSTEQPQNNEPQLNAQEINNNVMTFVTNLANIIKNACAADKMVEAIPGIKVAKEMQNCPVKQEYDDLNKAVADFANIEIKAETPDSIAKGFEAFNTIIDKLNVFNNAVNEKAKAAQEQQTNANQAQ